MDNLDILTKSQKDALEHFNKYASKFKVEAQNDINSILKNANIDRKDYQKAIENIKRYARIAINFHPDRPDSQRKTTIENLFEQGIYKNQFETLISAGGLSLSIPATSDQ